jgi:PLP dependent protein
MKFLNPESLERNITEVNQSITRTALVCGRKPESIRLVAVSKTISCETVGQALKSGIQILGENYIQEAKCKARELGEFPVSWHFIGHLQTNKAKTAVLMFDLIHTVDSLKTALELNRQARKIQKCQDILIQVNVAREASKSGIAPDKTQEIIEGISRLQNLSIRGLMTMPPYEKNPESSRTHFKALYLLSKTLEQAAIPGVSMEELSMGTTHDFTVAIEEGATLVRVGTAIFGTRK